MTFKILSLDGGGMRGIISARILKEVEAQLNAKNQKLNEYFDLVAGTSTGSILAAGTVIGKSPQEMIEIYLKDGNIIFPEDKRALRKVLPGGGGMVVPFTSYPKEGLESVLKRNLKSPAGTQIKMKDITKPIFLALAYDTWSRNTTYFASDRVDSSAWFKDNEVWEICLCSAAAPTYFPPHELKPTESHKSGARYPHIDGGVSANNPSLAAMCHAMFMHKIGLQDIAVLSIGTGQTNRRYTMEEVKGWGLIKWGQKIPDIFMAGPSEFQEGVAAQLMGFEEGNRYLRLNFDLNGKNGQKPGTLVNEYTNQPVSEAMDDPDQCNAWLEITEKYLDSQDRAGKGIKEKIAEFLDRNP